MVAPYRVVPFAAVSTAEQADPSKPSLDDQMACIEAHCQAQGWLVDERIRVAGHSRYYTRLSKLLADCAGYAHLVDLIEARAVDLIVVTDYDRLWRSDALRAQVMALCREHGVRVYALNQPTSPDATVDDAAFWMEVIFGAVAEQENRARVARAHVGMRGRVRRGLSAARGRVPYGYRRVAADQPFAVDPAAAPVVRHIFARRAQGWGVARIARELSQRGTPAPLGGAWNHSTIRYVLRNNFYIGAVHYHQRPLDPAQGDGGVDAAGAHAPLIDDDLWGTVQAVNARRHRARASNPAYIYHGLLRCGGCGSSMSYATRRRWGRGRRKLYTYMILTCSRYRHGQGCSNNYHRAERVHAVLLAALQGALDDPEAFAAALAERQRAHPDAAQLVALEGEVGDIDARLERWYDALESARFPLEVVADRQAALRARRGRCLAEIRALRRRLGRAEGRRREAAHMGALIDDLADQPGETLRAVALSLIARVVLRRGRPPEIVWH